MKEKDLKIDVSASIGSVTSISIEPKGMKSLLVLAHGAGAGMQHIFMETLSHKLAERSIGTLRFNFPFTENGKKRPDPAPIAEKTVSAVLDRARELYPGVAIFASGKSFGGRMSSHVLSKDKATFVKGIIFYGFPLHAAGQPSVSRADHLKSITVPMLFLQGTRDALAQLPLIQQVTGELPLAKLVAFEGADHSFKAGKKDIIPDLVETTASWTTTVLDS